MAPDRMRSTRRNALRIGAVGSTGAMFGLWTAASSARGDSAVITDGTTIQEPGEYELGGDIESGLENGACISIRAADVTLEGNGYRLEGPERGTGIAVDDSGNGATIRDLTVGNFDRGVEVRWATDVTIASVTSERNVDAGIWSDGYADWVCEGCTIRENGGDGIRLNSGDSLIVTNCELRDNDGRAIGGGWSAPVRVLDSAILQNGGPITLPTHPSSEVKRTEIEGNDRAGISTGDIDVVQTDDPVEIADCEITDNDGPGIEHTNSYLDVRRCTLSGNEDGYRVVNSGFDSKVRLRNNNVVNNESHGVVVEDASASSLVEAVDAECNYWGEKTGPDHEDNPRDDPQGAPVSDRVDFIPWSIEPIRDGQATCIGGTDSTFTIVDVDPEGDIQSLPGERVTVDVTVGNTGTERGIEDVELIVADRTAAVETLDLESGESRTVILRGEAPDEEGEYEWLVRTTDDRSLGRVLVVEREGDGSSLERYADAETGRVEIDGLRSGIEDLTAGEIDAEAFREILGAFLSGDTVA